MKRAGLKALGAPWEDGGFHQFIVVEVGVLLGQVGA